MSEGKEIDICQLTCGDIVVLLKNNPVGDKYDRVGPMSARCWRSMFAVTETVFCAL